VHALLAGRRQGAEIGEEVEFITTAGRLQLPAEERCKVTGKEWWFIFSPEREYYTAGKRLLPTEERCNLQIKILKTNKKSEETVCDRGRPDADCCSLFKLKQCTQTLVT